ncbi:hypothetical protein B0H10DRAFT_884204 [Mycena sp. CBHHK59/15]|nr:hypothetical protein B0H10DRAFT_884204 [Mycena sp. CBHHK59/15]
MESGGGGGDAGGRRSVGRWWGRRVGSGAFLRSECFFHISHFFPTRACSRDRSAFCTTSPSTRLAKTTMPSRRFQFDIGGAKLGARKAAQVSAYAACRGAGESSSRASRHHRAIRCRSLRPAAHIRARGRAPAARAADTPERLVVPQPNPDPHDAGLGDGVSEGLGRLRHEIRHERQKQLGRSPLSGADEQDCGGYAERGGVCPARA